jgi:WD40 repeat protein
MVTALGDNTLCLWDLKNDDVKKMEGHRGWVWTVGVSRDGRFIASGDHNGELIIWNVDTGKSLTQIVKAHSAAISSVDFPQDGAVLATGSVDKATKLWSTESWKQEGNPIDCGNYVHCIRYSPSGEHLAIATSGDVQIWNPCSRERIKTLKAHAAFNSAWNYSLLWTPDGRQFLTAGSSLDPTIREWNTSTWEQVGHPCRGSTKGINTLAINSAGTLVASTSHDYHVRLWRLSDRRLVASYKHSHTVCCVTFSTDGKHILSGGLDKKISQWAVPSLDSKACLNSSLLAMQKPHLLQILDMDSITRNACITGDLDAAEELLTQRIEADKNDHNAYANRSFVRARKDNWDGALCDALKVRYTIGHPL